MMNIIPKIGLDIDGVVADFRGAWHKLYPETNTNPNSYNFDHKIEERFITMRKKNTLNEFFLNLKPLVDPNEISFNPHCYITSRPVSSKISEQWLSKNRFPKKKVFCVGIKTSKIEAAKKAGIDIFIDDFFDNFVELNNAGITTYLYTAPWNLQYDVGNLRINSLNDLPFLK